ncbi:MAG: hypothetical protein OXB95_10085 [Rhodobacteraceae bacterium]|nr:hypothetical protein [Paracoccaceae bacterium]
MLAAFGNGFFAVGAVAAISVGGAHAESIETPAMIASESKRRISDILWRPAVVDLAGGKVATLNAIELQTRCREHHLACSPTLTLLKHA